MSRNRWIMFAAGIVLLVVLGAFAYDRTQSDQIAKGVTIGGVDVSGLDRAAAVAMLERDVQQVVQSPLIVIHGSGRRTLKPSKSKVGVDIEQLVDQAIDRSNSGLFLTNAAKSIAGTDRNIAIPVEITYSKPAVRRFVRSVHKSFDTPAKDASIRYSAGGISVVKAQRGLDVRSAALTAAIVQRLENPTQPRRIRAPMRRSEAKVTTRSQLAKKFPTIIVVDRKGFKLRLYKHLKLDKTYPIAVGQVGLETPAGLYSINTKQVDPAWHVPNSAWAGKLAGKTIPPGPGNPLVARWMGIYDGVGIHGTDDIGSLGSAASHGCIRMNPTDVIALYPLVPLGTPVYIA